MEEKVVLGEEAGEEHPVPLLVGDLLHEQRDAERPHAATERLGSLAECRAETAELGRETGGSLGVLGTEASQGRLGRRLGETAGRDDRLLEIAAKFGDEGRHGQITTVSPASRWPAI